MQCRMSMRSNGVVSDPTRRELPNWIAEVLHCTKKARRQLTAAHALACYRCFLPDLAGFTGLRCAGPAPDLLHHTIPSRDACCEPSADLEGATQPVVRATAASKDAKIKGLHASNDDSVALLTPPE